MNTGVVFFKTHSGSRTNIGANFDILTRESFVNEVNSLKPSRWGSLLDYWSTYRWGFIGGKAGNLKEMKLRDFEYLFCYPELNGTELVNCDLKKEVINELFRKEISQKWGSKYDKK